MKYAWDYLMNMFGLLHIRVDEFLFTISYYLDTITIITFIIAILFAAPLLKKILDINNKAMKCVINILLLLLFFLSTCSIADVTYNPFIYFRF